MELSFGQKADQETGFIMPWFTHGALDEISRTDWSGKVVWMWGAGMGDLWLAKRCKELHIVERVDEWIYKNLDLQLANGISNVKYYHRPCNEGSGAEEMYCEIPGGVRPDVFIVDDAYRYECILKALGHKPCTLVVDNWMQAFIFICPSAVEKLEGYACNIYEQHDHQDHDGINKWKTGIWQIR
jgi:hypothetical protein